MEEGKTMFGFGYSLEYICSFTLTLRPEVIGPLAEGLRVNYHRKDKGTLFLTLHNS